MKVTVCFGTVRVVVPCGDGDILIVDLIDKAVTRYKKATGKPSSCWVNVQYLKNLNDGGILDPDDRLNDVADDREQIQAIYDEQGVAGGSYLSHHNGGDGSSGSSTDCESPDIYVSEDNGVDDRLNCDADFEISSDIVPSGVSVLQVRRGSEPALNKMLPVSGSYVDPMKRWSTAVVLDGDNPNCSTPHQRCHGSKGHHSDGDFLSDREDGSGEERSTATTISRFSRDSMRSSILGNSDDGLPKLKIHHNNRREPLGGPNVPIIGTLIVIQNDGCPLGIHVVPEYNADDRDFGLVVQGIETGGKIFQDGRIAVGDRIVEINGLSLSNINFHRAQDMFKMALYSPEIRLRIVKTNRKIEGSSVLPAPVFPSRSSVESGSERANGTDVSAVDNSGRSMVPSAQKAIQFTHNVNTLSSNTRKIGKKYPILLTKGHNGLGFSITTRDNLAGVNCPIYVKNILPKGAAIEDGNLRAGDRLLEVNGVQMTGKSQDDAVSLLRNAPLGSTVKLIVSRQEPDSPKLPRQIGDPVERSPDDGHYFYWKQREILTFDIPLNDTGSAGLGVSVKGKTSTGPNGTTDLGIFVKSVIHGGAASKDGRLFENDQLIDINGVSLLRMPNSQAMETLRHVMHREGPNPGAITLSIARRLNTDNKSLERQPKRIESRSNAKSFAATADTIDIGGGRNLRTPSSIDSTTDSDHTAIYRPHGLRTKDEDSGVGCCVDKIEDKDLGLDCPSDMFNPVIERITGLQAPRNESYYRACRGDGWNSPQLPNDSSEKSTLPSSQLTMARPYDDTVIIEDEYVHHAKKVTKGNAKEAAATTADSNSGHKEKTVPTAATTAVSVSFVSQVSLDDENVNFDRDGFGRQSMSEKRNAQLDARNTDTWKRNKTARAAAKEKEGQLVLGQEDSAAGVPSSVGRRTNVAAGEPIYGRLPHSDGSSNLVRCNSADSVVSTTRRAKPQTKTQKPKSVTIAKSNSLESLQRVGQDVEGIYGGGGGNGGGRNAVGRGRGCNESFRAAVDRSYDAPSNSAGEAMETLDEEAEVGVQATNSRLVDRTCSLAPKQYRPGKKPKKGSLFRGLGSIFKFGKDKKEPETTQPNGKFGFIDNEFHNKIDPEMIPTKSSDRDSEKSWEHKRNVGDHFTTNPIADNSQRFVTDKTESAAVGTSGVYAGWNSSATNSAVNPPLPSSSSRHERINLLRAQHQKKHSERQGHYPLDDKEERLQWKVHEKVKEQQHQDFNEISREVVHSRSHSYDMCQEPTTTRHGTAMVIGCPDGRTTFSSSATATCSSSSSSSTSTKYGHYVNYEEIREHIRRQEQSRTTTGRRQERPISNYYEYESIPGPRVVHPQPPPPPRPLPALSVVPHPLNQHNRHHHHQHHLQPSFASSSNHGSLRGYPSNATRPRDQPTSMASQAVKKRSTSGKNSVVHPIQSLNNNNKYVRAKDGNNATGSKV